jgi:DNA-binding NarL/FixJ family response regulator
MKGGQAVGEDGRMKESGSQPQEAVGDGVVCINVIVADNHPLVRGGVRWALHRARHTMKVVGESDTSRDVLALSRKYRGAVYLLDIDMPDMDGLETARRLLVRDSTAKIILLGGHESGDIIPKAFRIGVRGYLAKGSTADEVREAITRVSAGAYHLSPRLSTHATCKEVPLTDREREVVRLISKGWNGREIAAKLKRSIHTVHAHRANLMAKVGLHNKADLIRYAARVGLAEET